MVQQQIFSGNVVKYYYVDQILVTNNVSKVSPLLRGGGGEAVQKSLSRKVPLPLGILHF